MEIRNVIELSAFSKSLSKKITYLNHEERILIDIEQIAAITPSSEGEDLPKKVCKNVTNQILRNGDISDKLIRYVHRIAYSNFSNKEIINGTINWSSTSEGSDYWFGLYINTKK